MKLSISIFAFAVLLTSLLPGAMASPAHDALEFLGLTNKLEARDLPDEIVKAVNNLKAREVTVTVSVCSGPTEASSLTTVPTVTPASTSEVSTPSGSSGIIPTTSAPGSQVTSTAPVPSTTETETTPTEATVTPTPSKSTSSVTSITSTNTSPSATTSSTQATASATSSSTVPVAPNNGAGVMKVNVASVAMAALAMAFF